MCRAIELFAGAGGMALGMELAGVCHVMLVESNKDCVATLRKNRPDWDTVYSDVAKVDFRGMDVDVVQGGFPCQAFSYAGRKRGFDDVRGTLFYEFARCVREVRPKIAIGENVRGLLRHDGGRTLETMVGVLEGLGYCVTYKLLRSQYYGVPQKRERLVLVALRSDVGMPFVFPRESIHTISVWEALDGCPASPGQSYSARKREIMDLVPPGGYWRDLPLEIQKDYMGASFYSGGGKTGIARRLSWDEPCLTLTCNPAQKQTERCHPSETRPLTLREYARIQTFPDDWDFAGSLSSQYRQVGNAVPVQLAYHIGRSIMEVCDV